MTVELFQKKVCNPSRSRLRYSRWVDRCTVLAYSICKLSAYVNFFATQEEEILFF